MFLTRIFVIVGYLFIALASCVASPTTVPSAQTIDNSLQMYSQLRLFYDRLGVHYTLEMDARGPKSAGMESLDWSVPTPPSDADQLMEDWRKRIPTADFIKDSEDPRVIHIIQKSLEREPHYIMSQHLSIKFEGLLDQMLQKLDLIQA